MLLGYNLPRDWAYSIDNGAFLTDPAALHDRMPAEAVQIEWDDTDPQTLTTAVTISAVRTQPFVPRVAALLGTDLTEGLRVELWGRRAEDSGNTYDLGGNSLTQRLMRLPEGGVGCRWVLADDLDPIIGYGLTIYNDAGAVVAIAPEAEHLIGEIVVAPAINLPHEVGAEETWSEQRTQASMGAQVSVISRTMYRMLKVQPCFSSHATARGNALPGGLDWQTVQAALSRDPFTLIVLYDESPDLIQRTGMFGVISGLGIGGLPGRRQRPKSLTVREVPP